MNWLAKFLSNLPMDSISDAANIVILWWIDFVADVPADSLSLYAYVGFSIIVLVLWFFIARVLPKPIGGISWIAVFAVLMTPSMSVNDTGELAPACIAAVYGLMMKDYGLVVRNILPILVVFTVGLFIGFIWELIRNIVESNQQKTEEIANAEEQENLALASANYVDVIEHPEMHQEQPTLIKTPKKR